MVFWYLFLILSLISGVFCLVFAPTAAQALLAAVLLSTVIVVARMKVGN